MAPGGAHEGEGFTTQSSPSKDLSTVQGLPVGMMPQEPTGGEHTLGSLRWAGFPRPCLTARVAGGDLSL